MEYTVKALAALAGVSGRALRFYDEIGLLRPARADGSGYRVYGPEEVDRLQQILFYKELGFGLAEIAEALMDGAFDQLAALQGHLQALRQKKARIDALIDTVVRTIQNEEEGAGMKDAEKFEGFKKGLVDENERLYGEEAREKYGDEAVEESNRKMMGLTREQYDAMERVAAALQALLEEAVGGGGLPTGEKGKEAARLHREWLSFTWAEYSVEAHKGLVDMYLADERFATHYDGKVGGCAGFLREAVWCWGEG